MKPDKIRILLFLLACFCFPFYTSANINSDSLKIKTPKPGDRSFLININPVISYIGNMFNGTYGNQISLSSAQIVYRKFLDNDRVKRYRLNMNLLSNQNKLRNGEFFTNTLLNGTSRSTDINMSFAYGKEKRYNLKYFTFYTGWELLSGFRHASEMYKYEYKDGDIIDAPFAVFYLDRKTSENVNYALSAGAAGIIGAEYYFSKMFYLNMEFSLPFVIEGNLVYPTKKEEINIPNDSNIIDIKPIESEKPTFLLNASFNSGQIAQFRAGVVF